MISIILPTFNESDNIGIIIPKLDKVFKKEGIKGEIIIVDDDSPDGTANIALKMTEKFPVTVHVRKNEKGLSSAVLKGFDLARGDICIIMDADLSHPVEKIPEMIKPIIANECDVTVGSRNISGGGSLEWPLSRKIISRVAGYLAIGVTSLSDPTSGFMAVRKSMIKDLDLDPLGWKIVLEVVVKAKPRLVEIPILFAERKMGMSKFGFKAQVDYLHHLWKLYCFEYGRKLLSFKRLIIKS